LLMAILLPSSRFHLTLGGGDPVAWHVRVTFAPSRTITSELVWESSMLGGTVTKQSASEGERERGTSSGADNICTPNFRQMLLLILRVCY
jgi:hypothetical protein